MGKTSAAMEDVLVTATLANTLEFIKNLPDQGFFKDLCTCYIILITYSSLLHLNIIIFHVYMMEV